VIALDAKINFDDNALFRHSDVAECATWTRKTRRNSRPAKFDLNYIALDGNIGCMVNGAGLAMATMDIIKLHGGEPANFLDVGGGATKEQVTEAFKIIRQRPERRRASWSTSSAASCKCDVIAEGVVAAAKEVHLDVPLVVRLEGTNVEQGRKILETRASRSRPPRAISTRRRTRSSRPRRLRRRTMSIWSTSDTKVLCQGITGGAGTFHSEQMRRLRHQDGRRRDAGQGRQPRRRLPVFDTVADAVEDTGADASVIYVPPPFAPTRSSRPIDAGIPLVAITEGIPSSTWSRSSVMRSKPDIRLIGPNCPGIITPDGKEGCKIGIMPGYIHQPGKIGVVSRSGTLTYEAVWQLTERRPRPDDLHRHRRRPRQRHQLHRLHLDLFNGDPETEGIVMIGEIGGTAEEEAAEFIKQSNVKKPVVGFIAGHGPPRLPASAWATRARSSMSSRRQGRPRQGRIDEFLSTIYGDDFREKTQAVQVLIQALSTGDPEVVQKSHAQLVRLTGQDLPPEHLAWHEWFRANRTKWLLQRVQQPGSPK
jgi:succinyl-CoA synthetase alpha subunit